MQTKDLRGLGGGEEVEIREEIELGLQSRVPLDPHLVLLLHGKS